MRDSYSAQKVARNMMRCRKQAKRYAANAVIRGNPHKPCAASRCCASKDVRQPASRRRACRDEVACAVRKIDTLMPCAVAAAARSNSVALYQRAAATERRQAYSHESAQKRRMAKTRRRVNRAHNQKRRQRVTPVARCVSQC